MYAGDFSPAFLPAFSMLLLFGALMKKRFDIKVGRLLSQVSSVSEEKALFDAFFGALTQSQRIRWLRWSLERVYPSVGKYDRVEKWMEGCFMKHPEWTPYRVASMGRNVFKLNTKMFPFLLKTAQKVKHRCMMRLKRKGEGRDE